jgi:hypothetical protein
MLSWAGPCSLLGSCQYTQAPQATGRHRTQHQPECMAGTTAAPNQHVLCCRGSHPPMLQPACMSAGQRHASDALLCPPHRILLQHHSSHIALSTHAQQRPRLYSQSMRLGPTARQRLSTHPLACSNPLLGYRFCVWWQMLFLRFFVCAAAAASWPGTRSQHTHQATKATNSIRMCCVHDVTSPASKVCAAGRALRCNTSVQRSSNMWNTECAEHIAAKDCKQPAWYPYCLGCSTPSATQRLIHTWYHLERVIHSLAPWHTPVAVWSMVHTGAAAAMLSFL